MRLDRVRDADPISKLRPWRVPHGRLDIMVAQSCNDLRYSRKRDVSSVSFLSCDAYMGLVWKNPQETFSIEPQ
jgi:hypothetical protein